MKGKIERISVDGKRGAIRVELTRRNLLAETERRISEQLAQRLVIRVGDKIIFPDGTVRALTTDELRRLDMTDYYKVLGYDGSAYHGGRGKWTPGRWCFVRGELIPCERGLHLCTLEQLPDWLGPTIWKAEVHPDSEIVEDRNKVVVRKARVVERLPWDDRTARLFAADCAEHVLHLFEAELPEDDRPRRAIEAARAYANGEIGEEELRAAEESAAWAARDAAWAACDAAWAARDAAWAAAADAARNAARYAAWAAAIADERSWQAQRLAHYLEPEGGHRVPGSRRR